ncbi:hypothetical protein [Porticoccus sp.]|uniref:hypothetical protein n=1 Tax=Porticoccus sp. TaxID=2024853 RepID=UPI003F69861F
MKQILTTLTLAALVATPFAYAADTTDSVNQAIKVGSDHGITHFTSIEFEDNGRLEIEGWIDREWHVELEVRLDGSDIDHEEREKRTGGPWGMAPDELSGYVEAAFEAGVADIDEITIDRRDMIEIEGDDVHGRDLEVYFQRGSREPVRISHDD